jgi:hypothetical protein
LKVVEPQTTKIGQQEAEATPLELPGEVLDDLVVKAQDLPNADGRPSILGDDLPQGLIVEGRKSFAIPDAPRAVGIRVANPRSTEWIRCRPGTEWSAIMYGIKDGNTGIVHPILPSLVQEIPQLAFQTKLWDFRMGVTSKKQPYLWPAPIGGSRALTPSEQVLREAQEASCKEWVMVWFDFERGSWQYRRPVIEEGDEKLPEPQFPDEPFQKYLARAVKRLPITSRDHAIVKEARRPT